jgi:hypothetical protein
MFTCFLVGIVCVAVGYGAGHFVTSAKLSAIEKEVGGITQYMSSETRVLANKIRSLL